MTSFTPTHVKKYFLLDSQSYPSDFDLNGLQSKRKKISARVGVDYVTPSKADSSQCRRGVDFILTHLQEPSFPRDIMTKKIGRKIDVFDKESILLHFEESNYQDCRISAYPRLTDYRRINLISPSFIMIDLDPNALSTELTLAKALKTTLNRIYRTLQTSPTVLWTGNGYHVYLPIKAFVLEEEEVFAKFQDGKTYGPSLSTKFIRFAEAFFTNEKHDSQHRPSVNSCLLRVPDSINSKNGQRVRIIQEWNGYRIPIQYMLRDFRRYLIQERIDSGYYTNNEQLVSSPTNNSDSSSFSKWINHNHSGSRSIEWIEWLLQNPIRNQRKYCIWRIFAPYLLNCKQLSNEQTYNIIISWLDGCSKLERLSFYHKPRVKDDIRRARRVGYYPISLSNLQKEKPDLYQLIKINFGGMK